MATKPAKKGKKDFNKESMYRKIMPSIRVSEEPEGETPAGEIPESPQTEAEAAPPSQEPLQPDTQVQPDTGGPVLRNVMEQIVREKIPKAMQLLNACQCERCCQDSMALTLNSLPCTYAVMTDGQVEDKILEIRKTHEVKIMAAAIRAVQIVKNQPRH